MPEVAAIDPQRLAHVGRPAEARGLRGKVGARVILVQPHLAVGLDRVDGRHEGPDAPRAPVEVGDRRADDVQVGRIERSSEPQVAAHRGPIGEAGHVVQVAVEEDTQLAPVRFLLHDARALLQVLAQTNLHVLGEVDLEPLRLRVAEDTKRARRALLECRHLYGGEGEVGLAPCLTQGVEGAVLALSPLGERLPEGLLEARHDALPGVVIEPLVRALRADVVAEHMVAELPLQVPQE